MDFERDFILFYFSFSVLRELLIQQHTIRYPGTGEYNKFYEEGIYKCAGCGTPLYKSTTKFDSGCGWPAFYEGLPGAINRTVSFPSYFALHFHLHLTHLDGLLPCLISLMLTCFCNRPILMEGG